MKVPALPFPARERRVAVEVLVAASAVMAVIARVRGLEGVALAGVALLVGAGFLLTARTPIGTVPLGYALVIALACLMPPELFYPVVSLGVLAAVPVLFFRPVLLRRVPVLFFRAVVAFLRRVPVRLRVVEPAAAVFRRVVRRRGRAARAFSTPSSSTCSCTGSTAGTSRCSIGSSGVLLNG